MNNIPMWHRRFQASRNCLSDACQWMQQAYYEDGDNAVFDKFYQKLERLLSSVDRQYARNLKRAKREGWLK